MAGPARPVTPICAILLRHLDFQYEGAFAEKMEIPKHVMYGKCDQNSGRVSDMSAALSDRQHVHLTHRPI